MAKKNADRVVWGVASNVQNPLEGVDEAVAALVEDELKQAIVVPIKQERGAMIGAARERAVEALQDEFQVRQWLRIRCLARIGAISRAKPR